MGRSLLGPSFLWEPVDESLPLSRIDKCSQEVQREKLNCSEQNRMHDYFLLFVLVILTSDRLPGPRTSSLERLLG